MGLVIAGVFMVVMGVARRYFRLRILLVRSILMGLPPDIAVARRMARLP
jgi:hypothetical protein